MNNELIRNLKLFILFAAFSSCMNTDYNFNDIEVVGSPEMSIPLVKGTIVVGDLVKSLDDPDGMINSSAKDGIIRLMYNQDNFGTYKISDYFNFSTSQYLDPTQIKVGKINIDNKTINSQVKFSEMTGPFKTKGFDISGSDGQTVPFPEVDLSETVDNPLPHMQITNDVFSLLKLESGNLRVTLKNNFPTGIKTTIYLYTNNPLKNLLDSIKFGYALPNGIASGNSETKTVTLANKTLGSTFNVELKHFWCASAPSALINFENTLAFSTIMENFVATGGTANIPLKNLSDSKDTIALNFANGEQLKYAKLSKGKLRISIEKSVGVSGKVILNFPSIKYQNNIVTYNLDFSANDLKRDYEFDLTNNELLLNAVAENPFNRLPVTYSTQIYKSNGMVTFESTDNFKVTGQLADIDISEATGYFGQRTITIANGTKDFNLDFWSQFEGKMAFNNPLINLVLNSSVGVPVQMNLDIKGFNNKGEVQALNPPVHTLKTPATMQSGSISDTIKINSSNSSISQFMSLPPEKKITYGGSIKLNPLGNNGIDNFIRKTDVFTIGMQMEIPMSIKTSNLGKTDTIEFSGKDLDQMLAAELVLFADNAIPLSLEVSLSFVDKNSYQQYGETIRSLLLDACKVNADGSLKERVISSHAITLTEAQLTEFKKASAIIMKIGLKSPENGTLPGTLYTSSDLKLNLLLRSKLNLNGNK